MISPVLVAWPIRFLWGLAVWVLLTHRIGLLHGVAWFGLTLLVGGLVLAAEPQYTNRIIDRIQADCIPAIVWGGGVFALGLAGVILLGGLLGVGPALTDLLVSPSFFPPPIDAMVWPGAVALPLAGVLVLGQVLGYLAVTEPAGVNRLPVAAALAGLMTASRGLGILITTVAACAGVGAIVRDFSEQPVRADTPPFLSGLVGGDGSRLGSPVERSATAFLVAGVLFFLDPVWFLRIGIFADGVPLPTSLIGLWNGLVTAGGLLAAVIGLLGVAYRLADRTPALARAAIVFVSVVGVAIVVHIVWMIGVSLLSATTMRDLDTLLLTTLPSWHSTTAPVFLLFGVASRRAGAPFRSLGTLLLALTATLVVDFLLPRFHSAVVEFPRWISVVVDGILPVLLLAIGYVVWKRLPRPNDRAS